MNLSKVDLPEASIADLEVIIHSQKLFATAAHSADERIRESEKSSLSAHERYRLLGEAAYILRLNELAERNFRASYDIKSSTVLAARLALCAYRLNDLGQAEEWIGRAVGAEPCGKVHALVLDEDISFMGIYATVLLSAGRPAEALAAAEVALNAWPEDAVARGVRADAKLLSGCPSEAIHDYNLAIEKSLGAVKAGFISRRQVAEGMSRASASGSVFVAKSSIADPRGI